MSPTHGQWTLADQSTIALKTSRVGLLSFHAHAPVVSGQVSLDPENVSVEFVVAIDRVSTGNPLLDPEVHALVNSGSDGTLTFSGTGKDLAEVTGHATAGNVTVPLELSGTASAAADAVDLQIDGRTQFTDIHLPLPGLGHIKHIDIDINGLFTLLRATADGQ